MQAKQARVFLVLLASAVLQQACSQNIGPLKIREDVSKAQAAGEKMVSDAQAYLNLVTAQNNSDVVNARLRARTIREMPQALPPTTPRQVVRALKHSKIADAQYEIDKARAQARYEAARAQCEEPAAAAANSCRDDTKANYDSATIVAEVRKYAAHLQATNSGLARLRTASLPGSSDRLRTP